MTPSLTHVMLLLLVAMAAAAPVAEQASGQEQMVNILGDSNAVDRAKRAQEEVVYGNQQNSARMTAAKKSVDLPPLFVSQAKQDLQPAAPYYPYPQFLAPDYTDKSGQMFAAQQQPVPQLKEQDQKTVAEVKPVAGSEKASSPSQKEEEEKQVDESRQVVSEKEEEKEEKVEEKGPVVEASEDVEEKILEPEPSEEAEVKEKEVAVAAPLPVEPEVYSAALPALPENSLKEDAEEALQAQQQALTAQPDDVESFLQELHGDEDDEQPAKDNEEAKETAQEDEEEGNVEAELMQKTGQSADEDVLDVDSPDYTKNLLKYILLRGNEFDRAPGDYGYPYLNPYSLYRRRRSLARSGLPHIHRRHSSSSSSSSSRQLARSKRTKRDLFDDGLYYDPEQQQAADRWLREEEEEEEEREKVADIKALISYLMALYPAVYEDQAPTQDSAYPWYPGYPEEPYPADYREWEEPAEYVEVPEEWEPEQLEPAWEPTFYPEEAEVPEYYPSPAKRQVLGAQRRKRYFYPFAREPYTHWGAFVPSQQKRDYDDAYRRLKELAMVLADARQPSTYMGAFDGYKK